MSVPDRACPDYPNECMHPWAHARTYAEVKATQGERSADPADHLMVMTAAVREVWRLALQWQGDDDTERQASDLFTALSSLVAWESEHRPPNERSIASSEGHVGGCATSNNVAQGTDSDREAS